MRPAMTATDEPIVNRPECPFTVGTGNPGRDSKDTSSPCTRAANSPRTDPRMTAMRGVCLVRAASAPQAASSFFASSESISSPSDERAQEVGGRAVESQPGDPAHLLQNPPVPGEMETGAGCDLHDPPVQLGRFRRPSPQVALE